MKREELLKSKEHWVFEIQNGLYNVIENYRKGKGINKTQLAQDFGVTKGYITQVLNGDFDHKISKLVELSLACNQVPLIHYMDLNQFIKDDEENCDYFIFRAATELIHAKIDCKEVLENWS